LAKKVLIASNIQYYQDRICLSESNGVLILVIIKVQVLPSSCGFKRQLQEMNKKKTVFFVTVLENFSI